ncbi:MAG: bifunctional folylpolyglutamate synthase/dihydrofolate synthase [Lachnospiraceae bacterium]|nr:bifunctional folylpolyglutamate synthase/dihydrofolate synthase [Lachnospiraceae bacterium]
MKTVYSYEEVIDIIQNSRRFGNLTGSEITKVMLEKLNHPEKNISYIHVAGTNGKGSVSAFLCNILKEAGLKTGMFTSPHLVHFEERIQTNGTMIPKEDVQRLGNLLLSEDFGVQPTMFDYCLAMALLYFKEQQCDVIVLETGLGGKYDSTNAVGTPTVSVITKIGFDHMAILGNTLVEIAGEKAGIIKKGTKLVCESQEPEVEEVFQKAAEQVGVSSIEILAPERIEIKDHQTFSAYGYEDLTMQMLGLHQFENATAAILAAEFYLTDYLHIKLESELEIKQELTEKISAQIQQAVRAGVANTKWQGRMEVLSTEPFFMVDGAHNAHGVTALRKSLESLFPGEKFHFLMGVMADKDYIDMIAELLPLAIDFTTVTVGYSRSLEAVELAECISKMGVKATSRSSLAEAMSEVTAERRAKTIAFGSLYFVGEIEEIFQ